MLDIDNNGGFTEETKSAFSSARERQVDVRCR